MGNGVNTQGEGRESVAFGTGGHSEKWGDFKKEKNEAAEQKFPGQRGCRIIFSERFQTLHCLKLKWMWTEFSVMTLRTEGTLGGRINRWGQRLIPKHWIKGWRCTSRPRPFSFSGRSCPQAPDPPLQECTPSQSSTHLTHLSLAFPLPGLCHPQQPVKVPFTLPNTRLGSLLTRLSTLAS